MGSADFQIIGAPSFFPTVWSWVKRWFDPIVVSKMFILADKDILPTLSEFIEVEDIPKKYGGGLDFDFGDAPNLGTSGLGGMIEWAEGHQKGLIPVGTIVWERAENGEMEMINVGTVDGNEKRDVIGRVKRNWEEVMYPGRTASPVSGQGGSTEQEQTEKAPINTVPAVATSAGPPVLATA